MKKAKIPMVSRRRLTLLVALILAASIALAGCNLNRRSDDAQPPAAGSEATESPNGASTEAVEGEPTFGPTSESDTLADEIDKLLQELEDLNSSADTLDDEP